VPLRGHAEEGLNVDRFVLRAIDELAVSGAGLAVITVPAPPLPIDDAARAPFPACGSADDPAPIVRWSSPAPEADGRAWCFAGSGEAARVEGSGEGRFDEVRGGADEIFASAVERRHEDAAFAPPLRLWGGLAFRPEPSRAAPWTAFRDASFALPRWLYGTDGERAFVQLAVRGRDRVDPEALRALFAWLAGEGKREREEGRGQRERERGAGGEGGERGAGGEAMLQRTQPEVWSAMIGDALARIRAHELEKVVPMALCRVAAEGALDAPATLARIAALYPDCFRFAFQRGPAVFLGASPERLVEKRGLAVQADALAGSAPRRFDGDGLDARAAAALLESDKDRREHRAVVDAIEGALRPLAQRIRVPGAPVVRTLRNVHHLSSPIVATLAEPAHVLDLVRALHPTPAVCGTPRDAAIRWIAEHEPATRGWYAGAVGWFEAAGDGAFAVAIRSGVLARREAWLYAGAGIVEGSDAAQEYAETRLKQAPMLAALGLLP
jgi:salicylate biosynthesis isochorismate synthase